MDIKFSAIKLLKSGTVVFPVGKDLKLSPLAAELDKKLGGALSRAAKDSAFKGEKGKLISLILGKDAALDHAILLGLGDKKELKAEKDIEALGGVLAAYLNAKRLKEATLVIEAGVGSLTPATMATHSAMGTTLRHYYFHKYFTKKKEEDKPSLAQLTIQVDTHTEAAREFARLYEVAEGVFVTRDLVSEPPNQLHPESYAAFCKTLQASGLKVDVLGEKEMQKLGMGALLGVGQGSEKESQLVVIQWNNAPRGADKRPLAFVGKGVTFDTGGISIKPAQGMEEMKYDMAGSGAVVGLMRALAGRKAKVNAVGVIGLVENMPGGNAQRPSDIVTSMSGQTIEVLNTDAEGRLVLADALWYAQDRFKPQLMVNLATLTGAIVVALGSEYAGLFSNNDELSERLIKAGEAVDERLWRFPLGKEYDKQIDSEVADMQNISNGKGAGSITAAQFLQRFVNDVPWAHLDIAGTAWVKKDKDVTPKGASGFGVRLLDRFIAENYEAK